MHAAVLARRRRYEKTKEFKKRYAERAGIEARKVGTTGCPDDEATNSELKRAHGLGRLRIRGLLRVRLAVHLKALACNVKRMVNYLVERGRKAAQAAAEGVEGAADAASCVILRLLGRGEVATAAFVARWRPSRAGRRDLDRAAAA